MITLSAPSSLVPTAVSAELLERLERFLLLPSLQIHPTRAAAWRSELDALGSLGEHPAVQQALHKQWSQRLVNSLVASQGNAEHDVTHLSEPSMPLVLADQPLLARLSRAAGVTLLGRQLRQTIMRADVLAASEALGAEGLQWARLEAIKLHPGLEDCSPWLHGNSSADYARAADLLGTGLVAQSWQDAPAVLRLRAEWKLLPEADDPDLRAASGLTTAQARALCLQLLARLDPTWLSLFPATH